MDLCDGSAGLIETDDELLGEWGVQERGFHSRDRVDLLRGVVGSLENAFPNLAEALDRKSVV